MSKLNPQDINKMMYVESRADKVERVSTMLGIGAGRLIQWASKHAMAIGYAASDTAIEGYKKYQDNLKK